MFLLRVTVLFKGRRQRYGKPVGGSLWQKVLGAHKSD